MSQDTNVENLIINKLTKQQFEGITPSDTELYMVTDEVISSVDVINALGYTPYNASNPAGYTSNIGTITSVNNIQPDTNGNVTIAIPDTATWGNITGTLSDQTDLQTALNGKQATLVSSTNIKTINSTSLLGSGDISVQPTITSSAMLSSDLVDDTNKTHKFATSAQLTQIATNTTDISTINGKIPAQATSSNQLADKAFVNSSVQTATANFRGNWGTWASVPTSASSYPADYAGSTTPTVNDYLVVQDASDYTGDTLEGTWRFKYSGTWATDGKNGWLPEYQVNETPLTAAQLAALNSGITSSDVTLIGTALQPTDLKTINGNSLVGSGNIIIDSLPSQTGQSGKFLTTNGTTASWATVTAPAWGNITGTLSNQTDLQDALDEKVEYAMVITDYTV